MREFKCSFDGEIVDLDDSKLYDYLPNTQKELRDLMFSIIGYVICYMDYWHSDWFGDTNRDGGQKTRVCNLIKYFTENERPNYNNLIWYKEQIFILQDETENMC